MNYKHLCKQLIKQIRNYQDETRCLRDMCLEADEAEDKAIKNLNLAREKLGDVECYLRNQELSMKIVGRERRVINEDENN